MKKFVLASKHHTLYLSERHLDWLHRNGYPEADAYFCGNDRSNPALVACIEAVHASMQPVVDEAYALLHKEETLRSAAEADREKLSAAIDAFVDVVKSCGVKYHKNIIIGTLRRPMTENMSWERAYAHFNSRFGVTVAEAQPAYEEYMRCLNSPAIFTMQEAQRELVAFCEEHGLRRHFNTIEIDDGYVIKTFDETRFTAKVVSASDEEYEHSYPSYWEEMELTPFVTRATIDSFVAEGDTDGLMEYLRSLNSNISIEV